MQQRILRLDGRAWRRLDEIAIHIEECQGFHCGNSLHKQISYSDEPDSILLDVHPAQPAQTMELPGAWA